MLLVHLRLGLISERQTNLENIFLYRTYFCQFGKVKVCKKSDIQNYSVPLFMDQIISCVAHGFFDVAGK